MFYKISVINHKSVAFIPSSYTVPPIINPLAAWMSVYVHAYWHETIKGQPVASYGVKSIFFEKEHLKSLGVKNNQPTYNEFLEYARASLKGGSAVEQTAVYRFRINRKYSNTHAINGSFSTVLNDYSKRDLENMLANPLQVPSNADGWYSLNSKIE